MCNLYRMSTSVTEVARLFNAQGMTESNAGELIYPGQPGIVVADGEVRSMTWGFPLSLKSKRTGEPLKPKPVNNARTDKLTSFMWRSSFENRRCLIPVSAWAEAEGKRGKMTRTWQSVADAEVFACAGIWRDSDEWGRVYSMVMTDAAGQAAEVHSRMPVILRPADHDAWQQGSSDEALALCAAYSGKLSIDRTTDLWARR